MTEHCQCCHRPDTFGAWLVLIVEPVEAKPVISAKCRFCCGLLEWPWSHDGMVRARLQWAKLCRRLFMLKDLDRRGRA